MWFQEHAIEIFGAITGILYVFLEIKQNIWLWPLGIVTSALYIFIFYNSGFYADMGLQWYYLLISIYGWRLWSRKEEADTSGENEAKGIKPQSAAPVTASILVVLSVFLFIIIRFVLIRYTDSTIPGWDAFTTALSIVATWMLAKKLIEHWFIWFIVNIVSVGLYFYKGLYPTVALFIVYAIMAIVGFLQWRKTMRLGSI